MNSLMVYLWLIADNINTAALTATLFLSIIIIKLILAISDCGVEDAKEIKKWLKSAITALIFSGSILTFLPNTKQIATIEILPKIANSEIAKAVPDDLTDMYSIAKEYLKEKLSDGEK